MIKFIVALLLLCNAFIAVGQTSDMEYVSIDGLKKSLGVNMNFRLPKGWSPGVGSPHVVKSFYNAEYGMVFNIVIVEAYAFISRNEFRNTVDDWHKMNEKQKREDPDVLYYSELSYGVTTIDQYPFIVTCFEEKRRSLGTSVSTMSYMTAYEDRVIIISFYNSFVDVRCFQFVIDDIIHSIKFPDQYLTY